MKPLITRTLIVPPRFFGDVIPEIYCPDDRIYWVDAAGGVHAFKLRGRLIDGVEE